MGKTVTFLHGADLHIGAPVRGLGSLTPPWEKRLGCAFVDAFDRLVATALRRKVDFVVLAGDCFDVAGASLQDRRRFEAGIARLHDGGVPVYGCGGNHDPLSLWHRQFPQLPEGLTMFPAKGPGFALYEKDGQPLCAVMGRSYGHKVFPQDQSMVDGINRKAALERWADETPPFCIGVIHTGLDFDLAKAPATREELLAANLDYWALGHIHHSLVYEQDDPRLGFSGCIQGRDIRETGPRGAMVVTLEEGRAPQVEFVPLASVVFEQPEVDVGNCESLAELMDVVLRALFTANGPDHCEAMVTRITLVGETKLHGLLGRPGVLEELRGEINDSYGDFFCDALLDRTQWPHRPGALTPETLETGFMASVGATAMRLCEDPAALVGHLQGEFLRRDLSIGHLSEQRAGALGVRAQRYIQDLLEEGRS